MKKSFCKNLLIVLLASITMFSTSCATILGGPITPYQQTKPAAGEPIRRIRTIAFLGDLVFGLIPLLVDFSTGAIYHPKAKVETGTEKVKTNDALDINR